jgi:peptide-methionine (S)-S-oxide reductase
VQQNTALEVIETIDASGDLPAKIVTEVAPFRGFFRAEAYHQGYLQKHPGGYSCHYIRPLDLGESR